MKVENIYGKRLIGPALVLVVILFGQAMSVKGQQLPPILNTGSTDPSAFDVQELQNIMKTYRDNVDKTGEANQAAAKLARNRLIGIGREQIDAMFNGYIKKDRKRRALIQFVLDFLEIGAATAIGITNGERAKTLISEGLGALQATRTSLNKNFQLLERQILINKMAADRATILTGIYAKRDLEANQYPWEDARAELRTYRDAGTIDGALINLSSDVGRQKEDAEDRLREVTGKAITGAATEVDLLSAKGAFAVRNSLRKDLADPTTQAAALQTLQRIVERLLASDKEIADLMRAKNVSATTTNGTDILNAIRDTNTTLTIMNRRDLVRKVNQITVDAANPQ
jgi:hypothetical protein